MKNIRINQLMELKDNQLLKLFNNENVNKFFEFCAYNFSMNFDNKLVAFNQNNDAQYLLSFKEWNYHYTFLKMGSNAVDVLNADKTKIINLYDSCDVTNVTNYTSNQLYLNDEELKLLEELLLTFYNHKKYSSQIIETINYISVLHFSKNKKDIKKPNFKYIFDDQLMCYKFFKLVTNSAGNFIYSIESRIIKNMLSKKSKSTLNILNVLKKELEEQIEKVK
ncbi:MAG: hypothetical protein WBO70_02050 [Erysipelotrichaceae bacterium]